MNNVIVYTENRVVFVETVVKLMTHFGLEAWTIEGYFFQDENLREHDNLLILANYKHPGIDAFGKGYFLKDLEDVIV